MKTQRQMTREAMKRAGLHKTRAQRREYEATMTRVLGYKPAKLSDLVKKPSRYTVRKRAVQYAVTKTTVPAERVMGGYRTNIWGERVPSFIVSKPERTIVEKTPIGERLIIKRLAKRGQGKGGGGSADRGVSHKTGSAVARRTTARLAARLGGKRGGRPRSEKKKKKKK